MFERYADPDSRQGEAETLAERPFVRLGPGVLHEVGIVAQRLKMHKALVVVDPHLAHSAAARLVGIRLAEHNVRSVQTDRVTPTPLYADVHSAEELMRKEHCDGVVALGGGSTIDVAKVAALVGKHGGRIRDYAHEKKEVDSALPVIACPTTAGTGAESSSYAFLLEDHGHEHTILHHPVLMAEAVLMDPLTHLSMPPRVTAATGMNALTDAIEAYVSRGHTEAADEDALEAVRLIGENLPRAYEDGQDLDARAGMAKAAWLAGRAFNETGLGIVDSISLVISGLFNVGHSTANAIILPYAMAYDAFAVDGRLADIAAALGHPAPGGADEGVQAQAAIEAVQDLKRRVGITQNLADRGVSWDDLYLCASNILHHPFASRNPRRLDERGVTEILLDAIEGTDVRFEGGARA